MNHKQRFGWKVQIEQDQKLSNNEIKELLEEAPRIVADAIRRGWITPPKYKLTSAQIDNLMRR